MWNSFFRELSVEEEMELVAQHKDEHGLTRCLRAMVKASAVNIPVILHVIQYGFGRLFLRIALIPVLVLSAGFALDSVAQRSCSIEPGSAVADTLDYSRYYPLDVGNVWEYRVQDGSFEGNPFRVSAIGDTLIGGLRFYRLQVIVFEHDVPIVHADTSEGFVHVSDTAIVQYSHGNWNAKPIHLSSHFNVCYTSLYGELFEVRGGYDGTVTVNESGQGTTYSVRAIKEFLSIGGEETYAYDIGLVRIEGDPFILTSLVYADLSGREIGTPLDSIFDIQVGIENARLPINAELNVYPTPTQSSVQVEISLARPSEVSLFVIDVLGRKISEIFEGFQTSLTGHYSLSSNGLPSGMYFVVAATPNGITLQKPFIVVY